MPCEATLAQCTDRHFEGVKKLLLSLGKQLE